MLSLRVGEDSVPVPEPALGPEARVTVWRDVEGELCAWSDSHDGVRWIYVPHVGSYSFGPDEGEVRVVPDPSAPVDLLHIAYVRTVLPMAVQALGREVLHASAVLARDGVVAFCAISTTGKSALAAEFNRRDYALWADDAVAWEHIRGTTEAVALPFELASDVAGDTRRPPLERAPFAAACVLERLSAPSDESATVTALTPSEAFIALLTHAYCYSLEDVDRNRRMMDQYLEFARVVPVYRVRFQPGLGKLPATVRMVERELEMSPRDVT